MSEMREPALDVSVVVLTVDRFEMADLAIDSVMRQDNRLGLKFEVIVVDNSADQASRARIEAAAATAPHPLRYVHEPRRNIAHARNAGILASHAEFVAFVDDDEIAESDWLDALVTTARRSTADLVTGPVYPSFEGGSPPWWDPEGQLAIRDRAVATGTSVTHGPTGNSLFRVSTCFGNPQPFDEALGLTGGEDTDFTMRLKRDGRKIVWCAEAVITEFQPASRMTLRYWSRRTFITTQSFVRSKLRNSDRRAYDRTYILVTASIQLVFFFVPFLVSYGFPTPKTARLRFTFLRGLGKILYPFRVNFY